MTQVQDAQTDPQTVNGDQQNGTGDTTDASGPMPEPESRFKSMEEKAKARLEKGAETSPHLKTRHRDESQATDSDEPASGESEAVSTSGESDNQNRTDAVDSSQQGDTPQPEASGADADEVTLDQAKAAMKRSQWGDEQINALPESEILKAGQKLVKREEEREKNYKQKKQIQDTLKEAGLDAETPDALRQSLNQLLGQQAQQSGQDQQKDQTEPQSDDSKEGGDIKQAVHQKIDSAMQQLSNDELMSDSAETLKKAMTDSLDSVIDHYEARLPSAQAQPAEPDQNGQQASDSSQQGNQAESQDQPESSELQQIRQQYETLAMDQTMIASGLDQEYNQLKEPETRAKVRDHARTLVNSDSDGVLYWDSEGNPQWHEALKHAAYLNLGAPPSSQADPQQQKADLLNRQRAVSNGQPSPDREARTQKSDTSQMSKMERMTMLAKARDEGKSEQEIQQLRQQLYGHKG